MRAALNTALPGWSVTAHARRRAAERGLTGTELCLVVEAPTLAYPQSGSYGPDRQVRVRGEWAAIVDPSTHTVITVLFRDPARWNALTATGLRHAS